MTQAMPIVSRNQSAKSKNTSTDVGIRGLVIVRDPDNFDLVNEDDWRALDSYAVSDQAGDLKSLASLNVSLARLQESVFVDLDQLTQLDSTPGSDDAEGTPPRKPGQKLTVPSGTAVILKEFNKLYIIPEAMWQSVNSAITGDAAVLINRHALLAPIPKSPIPSGTFCVLINFLGIDGAT